MNVGATWGCRGECTCRSHELNELFVVGDHQDRDDTRVDDGQNGRLALSTDYHLWTAWFGAGWHATSQASGRGGV